MGIPTLANAEDEVELGDDFMTLAKSLPQCVVARDGDLVVLLHGSRRVCEFDSAREARADILSHTFVSSLRAAFQAWDARQRARAALGAS